MKLFFYIHHLGNGGAERVTSVLANELGRTGNEVTICMHHHNTNTYKTSEKVSLLYLPETNSRIRRLNNLRKIVQKNRPDVIIAVMPYNYVSIKIATMGLNIPIIVSDHTNFRWNANKLLKFIRYYLYRFATIVTVLSNNDKRFMEHRLHNMRVMYNPLSFPRLGEGTERRKNILCVGRVSVWEVKGFDLIIRIWSKIADKHPDWTLEIAGDGNENDFNYLKSLAEENGMINRMNFLGFRSDIVDVMSHSSIFALPSRIEGFPCSLLEAMSQGCAPVAFDIHGIMYEIISDGKDGFIVKDGNLDGFCQRLEQLMNDEDLIGTIGRNAIDSVKRFEVEKIGKEWQEMLTEVVETKKK